MKFSEDSLIKYAKKMKHNIDVEHLMESYDEIIECEVDGRIQQLHFRCWKTKSCGHKDCHHPLTFSATMQTTPYKITYRDK